MPPELQEPGAESGDVFCVLRALFQITGVGGECSSSRTSRTLEAFHWSLNCGYFGKRASCISCAQRTMGSCTACPSPATVQGSAPASCWWRLRRVPLRLQNSAAPLTAEGCSGVPPFTPRFNPCRVSPCCTSGLSGRRWVLMAGLGRWRVGGQCGCIGEHDAQPSQHHAQLLGTVPSPRHPPSSVMPKGNSLFSWHFLGTD